MGFCESNILCNNAEYIHHICSVTSYFANDDLTMHPSQTGIEKIRHDFGEHPFVCGSKHIAELTIFRWLWILLCELCQVIKLI